MPDVFMVTNEYYKLRECCFVSSSDFYYNCVNTINCTGQNISEGLLLARGVADANMYLCSLRPGENVLSFLSLFVLRIPGGPKKRGHSTFSQISRKLLKISK